jgi:murein DD-endopeptidase MepM/ murein hydrolase activator NlpD
MKTLKDVLIAAEKDMHVVVPFDPATDKVVAMDFTVTNKALTGEMINDVALFSDYVDGVRMKAGALYGIGGYGEHRTIYSRSSVFNSTGDGEPRRFHLGLDIWGESGTPVFAPIDATVHSFAFNDSYGDYGATIILQHELGGIVFYSLYGHLSLADLDMTEGRPLKKGELFAHFGKPTENGHWPPHLHLQLIMDLNGAWGDYPGVCRFSERVQYLKNCPDPDLLCHLYSFVSNNKMIHL